MTANIDLVEAEAEAAAAALTSQDGVTGRSQVGHNTLLNFLGLAVPLALAFFIMPIAARGLGTERFGLLGLAWAVTEYLTLFDLGLGRALVKFVADALHRDSADLNELVSIGLAVQIAAGVVGGAAFALVAPVLVHSVFHVSSAISDEALGAFRVVGLSVPFVLLMTGQRAVLEGAQRFDLSASLKMLASIASLSIPAIGAVIGASLPTILLAVLVARIIVAVLFAIAIRRAIPSFRWVRSTNRAVLRKVLSFGGWVLVSNTVSPLLVFFDRFALGSIAGLAAVGLYTAPYEGVTRMLLIPVSLFSALLPALTSMEAANDRERFTRLAATSERMLAPLIAAPLALVFVFAPEILQVWLGGIYSAQSTIALRVLAVGVLANSLANPLMVMVYAKNRPDLPARFHLLELAIHIPVTVALIRSFGITGAAVAWSTRVVLDMCLLLWAAAHTTQKPMAAVIGGRAGRTAGLIVLLVVSLWGARALAAVSVAVSLAAAITALAVFSGLAWRWILDEPDRGALTRTFRSYALPRRAATG